MLSKHHTVLDKVYLNDLFVNLFIPISSGLGIAFAIFLWIRVSAVKVRPSDGHQRTENGREYLLEEESRAEAEVGYTRPTLICGRQLIRNRASRYSRVCYVQRPSTCIAKCRHP